MRIDEHIAKAISKSEDYLISVYRGYWSDFLLMPGPSNLWISAMVITVTKPTLNPILQAFRTDAFNDLTAYAEKSNFSIGYNKITPYDCDSSIWLARAYASLNRAVPPSLLAYINSHLDKTSRYASTYIPSDNIDQFIGVPSEQLVGWYESHSCVTANYLSLIRELESCIHSKGKSAIGSSFNLDSYWWPTDAYIVALCPYLLRCDSFQCKLLDSFIASFSPPISDYPSAQNLVRILGSLFDVVANTELLMSYEFLDTFKKIDQLILDPKNHSWMILPLPENRDRYFQSRWEYGGLRQGAAVSDRSGVFTICVLLSILYYIKGSLPIKISS